MIYRSAKAGETRADSAIDDALKAMTAGDVATGDHLLHYIDHDRWGTMLAGCPDNEQVMPTM